MNGDYRDIEDLALKARRLTAQMTARAKASHIGGCFSCADIMAYIFSEILSTEEDSGRFFLSKGHCIAMLFSILKLKGYISNDLINEYGKNGSQFMQHCTHYVKPIRFSTGSLGSGFPVAVGYADALTRKEKSRNDAVCTLISDGELDEGSTWEAIYFAGHRAVNNIRLFIDYNNQQSLGSKEETLNMNGLEERLKLAGWRVGTCDGNKIESIDRTYNETKVSGEGPVAIICKTIKGYPISFMKDSVDWHYKSLNSDQLVQVLEELS